MPDPAWLAALHARCFTSPPPWSEAALAAALADPAAFLCSEGAGFALGRVTLDEAELLTLAVAPEARRQGQGARLVAAFEAAAAARGAVRAHLEVAADNSAARALYARAGWQETGRRRGYFRRPGGPAADAVLMAKALAGGTGDT